MELSLRKTTWGQKVGKETDFPLCSCFLLLSQQALELLVKNSKKDMGKPTKIASHKGIYSDNLYRVNTKG